MTAEVGVMNSIGVALAADSAVSIGIDSRKIFTSSDKLFQLSRVAPVGIMTYGNAVVAGVPWETVVKEYRGRLKLRTFGHLADYAHDFLRFLGANNGVLSAQDRAGSALVLVKLFYLYLREDIRRHIDDAAEKADGLRETDLPKVVAEPISDREEQVMRSERLMTGREMQTTRRRYGRAIRQARDEIFGTLPMTAATSRLLVSLAFEMLSRGYFGPLKSGLVFAGFGDKEFRPRLIAFELDGLIGRRLRIAKRHDQTIGPGGSAASVIPFAQQEVVHAFMEGVDGSIEQFMKQSSRAAVTGAVVALVDAVAAADRRLGNKVRKVALPATEKLLEALYGQWEAQCRSHWEPIVQIVSTLPKDELASMAEALVNLTKFRRRITPARETVGGPIDVAVITKGDGFVWIKRKHYFDPKLNPRIMSRLEREAST